MLERFSDNTKKMMQGAQVAARRHRSDTLDAEHLLIGILEVEGSTAERMLSDVGVDITDLLTALETMLPPGGQDSPSALPFSPACKAILELAMREAAERRSNHIASQHLLLAVAKHGENDAANVLAKVGATAEALTEVTTESLPSRERARLRLLLVSNSTMHGGGYLAHCKAEVENFLGERKTVLFVPYALADHNGYEAKAQAAFRAMGYELTSIHHHKKKAEAVDAAEAVFIGGGNTFRLLATLDHHGLLTAIRSRALAGMPYMGSSAGTNVATRSIRTTNDMPIVQPPSFTALQLVPFQINPHYLDPDPASSHMGETREERILQFHEEHETPVLGLREGCMLRVEGERMELRGTTAARLFRRGEKPVEYAPPCDLSFLMED
ncbi:MAG: dipeptidase PepE [Planctomycetota bacterium]